MIRALFLIAQIIILFSCGKSPSQEILSGNFELDSTKVVYDAAFKICSLKYEVEHAEISWVISNLIQKDTLKGNADKRKLDEQELLYQNSIDAFIQLTKFGSKDIWNIEDYTNFIRIQYLQSHLPEEYFANHKTEILSISRESNRSLKEFKNPSDTSQTFMLCNLTMKVLEEIDIDSNMVNYHDLKNINILVQSFGSFIDPDFFPCFIQDKKYNCGPACLKIIADHYNVYYSMPTIEKLAETDTSGTTFLQLAVASKKMGFDATHRRVSFEKLLELELPTIVHWNDNHFVVLYEITEDKIKIADPSIGSAHISRETFCAHWLFDDGKAVTEGNILEIKLKK